VEFSRVISYTRVRAATLIKDLSMTAKSQFMAGDRFAYLTAERLRALLSYDTGQRRGAA
jgi:hypothetical protein